MIKIKDGRTELYQWDTGSVLAVGEGIDEVHFARSPMGRSITVPVVSGEAKVEDVLLQTSGKLFVWGFVGSVEDGYTKLEREFTVRARNKPADYVFTPPEQITMAEILEELKRVQDVVTPEAVGALVEEYLRENPVEGSVEVDATLTKQGYAADAKAVGDALGNKFNKQQGAENAGKLMFVGEDGEIIPLALGAGLKIKDGVLMIVNAAVTAAICGQFKCGEVVCGGTK